MSCSGTDGVPIITTTSSTAIPDAVDVCPWLSRSWLAEQLYDLVLGLDVIAHTTAVSSFVDYSGLVRALHDALHRLADKVAASASRPGSLGKEYADRLRTLAADSAHEVQRRVRSNGTHHAHAYMHEPDPTDGVCGNRGSDR